MINNIHNKESAIINNNETNESTYTAKTKAKFNINEAK